MEFSVPRALADPDTYRFGEPDDAITITTLYSATAAATPGSSSGSACARHRFSFQEFSLGVPGKFRPSCPGTIQAPRHDQDVPRHDQTISRSRGEIVNL